MTYETLLVETRGRVGLVTFNRPQALNALNRQLLDELRGVLAGFEADAGIGAVVLRTEHSLDEMDQQTALRMREAIDEARGRLADLGPTYLGLVEARGDLNRARDVRVTAELQAQGEAAGRTGAAPRRGDVRRGGKRWG